MTTSHAGLLIIRAWVEPGSSLPLRAHIRWTTDVSQGLQKGLTVAEEEAVVAAVQAWLSEMVAGALTGEDNSDNPSSM